MCPGCKHIFLSVEGAAGGNRLWCRPCFEDRFGECQECGRMVENADIVEDPESGDYLCTPCYSQRNAHRVTQRDREQGKIFNYRFDVVRGLRVQIPEGKRLFGVELEVSIDETVDEVSDVAKRVYASDSRLVCKSDSSIRGGSGYGFEIVTAPLSRKDQEEVLEHICSAKGIQEHSTCGMHVHISRAALQKSQIAKAILFLHGAPCYGFVNWVAGRNSETYASLKARKWKDAGVLTSSSAVGHDPHTRSIENVDRRYIQRTGLRVNPNGWQHAGRYQALNLCNPFTIEFRIFATTVSADRARANLEFCDALMDYVGGVRPMKDMTNPQAFVDFVMENPKEYPYLHQRLRDEANAVKKALAEVRKPECGHKMPTYGYLCNQEQGHRGTHGVVDTNSHRFMIRWDNAGMAI